MVLPPRPALNLEKQAQLDVEGDRVMAGDVISYTFTASNDGNVTLHGVTIADPLPGLSALEITWPATDGTLAPGESAIATATYVVTQADIDAGMVPNTATATGLTPTQEAVSGEDSVLVPLPPDPGLSLQKTAEHEGSVWHVGDLVAFGFTLTNTGNVTETGVVIADPMPGLTALSYS